MRTSISTFTTLNSNIVMLLMRKKRISQKTPQLKLFLWFWTCDLTAFMLSPPTENRSRDGIFVRSNKTHNHKKKRGFSIHFWKSKKNFFFFFYRIFHPFDISDIYLKKGYTYTQDNYTLKIHLICITETFFVPSFSTYIVINLGWLFSDIA